MRKRKIMRKLREHLAYHRSMGRSEELGQAHEEQINALQRSVAACRDCGTKLAEQTKEINALRNESAKQATLIVALTEQLAVVSRKLETTLELVSTLQTRLVTAEKTAIVKEEAPKKTDEPKKADDLQLIEGIGPKIAEVLMKEGIATFKQLASTDPAQIKKILVVANLRGPADPSTWPQQAQLAAEGKMNELRALQAILDGGRMPTG